MSNQLIEKIIGFARELTIAVFIKFVLIVFSFFYIIYAFAMWRQVQLMSSVVEVGDVTTLRVLGLTHLLGAIAVFILAFILL